MTAAVDFVCLFDIDGTLLRTGGAGMAALEAALTAEFGISRVHDVPVSGRTDRAIIGDLFHLHGVPNSDANWQLLCRAYLALLPASLAARQGVILPGVVQRLQELSDCGNAAVGLLTGNIHCGAKTKLSHFGLDRYFTFGAFGDEHLDRDEVARAAWQTIQQQFGSSISPQRVWVIGDTPLDVQCAKAIGVKCVAVATGTYTLDQLAATDPDLLLADLSDAPAWWKTATHVGDSASPLRSECRPAC